MSSGLKVGKISSSPETITVSFAESAKLAPVSLDRQHGGGNPLYTATQPDANGVVRVLAEDISLTRVRQAQEISNAKPVSAYRLLGGI